LLLLVSLSACTLGPDPNQKPETAADTAESYQHSAKTGTEEMAVARWWETFADPVTSELVAQALEENTDLRAAAARVMEAEAGLAAARGTRWPEASLSVSGSRSKVSFVMPSIGRVGIYSTTYADDLSVSYQVDLFGRLARARQAAWSDLLAAEASRQAVVHSVIAAVVRGRVQVASLQQQLALAESTAMSWQTTFNIVEDRYSMGLVDAEEMHLTRQSLAAAEAAIPGLEQALAAARHGLDLLVGRRPGSRNELPESLPPAPDLAPVPVGLPADLLDRRPDLVQARMQLSSATARIGIAMAKLYPSLTLTGSTGTRSDTLSDLTTTDGLVYNAVASLLAPLFSGGQLRAEVRAAEARTEQAAATYAGAVLQALREVEDALVAEEALARQLVARKVQLESSSAAEELARSHYHAGTGSMLQLLVADRARTTAEAALITARADQWQARVALILALGGDWQLPRSTKEVDS
jgi:multidrug efflux system outer membrane protein